MYAYTPGVSFSPLTGFVPLSTMKARRHEGAVAIPRAKIYFQRDTTAFLALIPRSWRL